MRVPDDLATDMYACISCLYVCVCVCASAAYAHVGRIDKVNASFVPGHELATECAIASG